MKPIEINETHITILEGFYTQATARVHMDNQVSEKVPVHRGVGQGVPISLKLFTATIQEGFFLKHVQLEEQG